jgi:hypothetical protein
MSQYLERRADEKGDSTPDSVSSDQPRPSWSCSLTGALASYVDLRQLISNLYIEKIPTVFGHRIFPSSLRFPHRNFTHLRAQCSLLAMFCASIRLTYRVSVLILMLSIAHDLSKFVLVVITSYSPVIIDLRP